jgi:hypothetical protein
MPIRPECRALYPPNWREIAARIRARAQNRCEWCGVPNHTLIVREGERWRTVEGVEAEVALMDGERVVRIVLTVAHLDHDPRNCADTNLAALCQKCHLNYDRHHHATNAARTRDARRRQGRLCFTGENVNEPDHQHQS